MEGKLKKHPYHHAHKGSNFDLQDVLKASLTQDSQANLGVGGFMSPSFCNKENAQPPQVMRRVQSVHLKKSIAQS